MNVYVVNICKFWNKDYLRQGKYEQEEKKKNG